MNIKTRRRGHIIPFDPNASAEGSRKTRASQTEEDVQKAEQIKREKIVAAGIPPFIPHHLRK